MASVKAYSAFLFGLLMASSCVMKSSAGSKDNADDEDKMGMGVLYEMVHFFLGDVIQTKNISESFLNLSTVFNNNEFDSDALSDWKEWADYGKGYAAGAVIGILFIVFMPIVGLFFCCCRVCGKCGGKPRKHDSRRSKCKRRTYCTLIVVFNTLALAGVVCSFMCSHLIYKALQNENNEGTVGHIRESLTSIKNFTDVAVNNVSNTVTFTYEDVAHKAITNINNTGFEAVDIVLKSLNATQHLDKAREISKVVNETKDQLDNVNVLLGQLINSSNVLKDNLTSIRDAIDSVCNPPSDCQGFDASQYDTEADFSRLNKLQDEAAKVAKTMSMTQYVQDAENNIEKAKQDTETSINVALNDARNSIDETRKDVRKGLTDLRTQKDDAMSFYPGTEQDLKDIDDDIRDGYSDHVYYGCVGVSCVYLLIVVLYYLGIVFGLCGERPGHDAPCCNRGTGASFLMAGVGFTFIFSWILMLLCTILFVIGGISYTEVCRYFHGHDPANFKVFDDTLNNGLDLSKTLYDKPGVKFSISQSIRDCQQNQPLYHAFLMENIVDWNKTIDITKLKTKLDELQNSNLNIDNITIISSDLKADLKDFSQAGIQSINFTDYFIELDKNITKVTVTELYKIVQALADNEQDDSNKKVLQTQADRLAELNAHTIPAMRRDVENLKTTVRKLEDGSDIPKSIDGLISGLEQSQEKFNKDKETLVKSKIQDVANIIFDDTDRAVDNLINKISTDTARCKPLSDSLYSISDSVCVLLVDPVNGLWFSFGWCLFFFVLCLIFGVLLAGEYRHECKYGKEFDDPLFDGRNHDMMPLTSHSSHMDRPGYRGDYTREQRHPPSHLYQTPDGVHNSGFSPDMKHRANAPPPPYGHHMQPGIAAYASSPPPEYNGHQHHDLASAYPAVANRGGHSYLASSKNSYSYPY